MRVVVIGGGGREHALVWKISQSPTVRGRRDLLCIPGNKGIESLAECLPAPAGGLANVTALADLAVHQRAGLVVVGPELPLSLGLTDELSRRGVPAFGASRAASQLEASKAFAKQFMARHGIPTAPFEVFSSLRESLSYLGSSDRRYPIVVKADGLAAGKGVVVADSRQEAEAAVTAMLQEKRFGAAGEKVVIEEHLSGIEVSFFALTDGRTALPLATCQDYKRALEEDRGPNTGGMGAYSPSVEIDSRLEREIMHRIIRPAVRGMAAEGVPYLGVIYAGLMLTQAGPSVLEFNARFGDPETQVLMPRLESDLVPLLLWAAGAEDRPEPPEEIRWTSDWAACVVVASRGYPESAESGRLIKGLESAAQVEQTVVFHAGTSGSTEDPGGSGAVTAGGRVLAVSSRGRDLKQAVERAYRSVARIRFDGMQFRRDIGRSALSRLESRGKLTSSEA